MTGFTYKSYNFVDKDPIIDYARTPVQASGMTYKALHEATNVSVATIRNMFDGKTRRPQAATLNAILRACGHKLSVRPIHEVDAVTPTISVRHVIAIAKYRGLRKTKEKAKRA